MLSLNLSLHRMLPFGSCISIFYQSKIKTTKVCISTDLLWLNQNYFFYRAFWFCSLGWIPPWLAALCPSPCASCPAAGHREGWGWVHAAPGIPGYVSQPHSHRGIMSTAVLLLEMCQAGLRSMTAALKGVLAEQTHSWRQNRQQCQWQAWSHIPSGGTGFGISRSQW